MLQNQIVKKEIKNSNKWYIRQGHKISFEYAVEGIGDVPWIYILKMFLLRKQKEGLPISSYDTVPSIKLAL